MNYPAAEQRSILKELIVNRYKGRGTSLTNEVINIIRVIPRLSLGISLAI